MKAPLLLHKPLEKDIQKAILEYLKWRGVFAWRNQSQGTWDPTKHTFRSGQTMKGVPDILGILPGGRFLGIEVKRPGGKVSVDQELWHRQACQLNALVMVAYSVEDVRKADI